MAEPQRRSTEDDSTQHEDSDDPSTGGTVSETDAPDGQAGLGDAPDAEPQGESTLADADPRSAQTAGASTTSDDPEGADDSDAGETPAAAAAKKTTTTKAAASGVKAKKDADEKSGSTRSGNPARKAAADQRGKKSSGRISRTPAKPKVIGNRWAAPLMLASAGIGLAWIVVFYVTQDRIDIPWYSDLGSWNLVIGMGFIVAAFGFAMKWE